MIFLNILQNVTISLMKYFVSYITVIYRNDTFLYRRKYQIFLSLVSIMGYLVINWDNCFYIFWLTFPCEIIWSLKIIIKQLLKKEERQFVWKMYFLTFDKVQKVEANQLAEKLC